LGKFPRISIITPNFNGAKFLEQTILSVIGQNYPNLEYIIIDGCSSDGSIEIIKKYENKIAFWISEPDNGMYDAIQKGFDKCSGEILGWINSDDILQNNSLFALAEIFSSNKKIRWIQGYPNVIDEKGRIVYHRSHRYNKYDFYLKDYHDGVFIQQESTFWTEDLWKESGAALSKKYKYAGDFELWIRFFLYDNLYTTNTLLGSFRSHSNGQISRDLYNEYIHECDQIVEDALDSLPLSEKKRIDKIKVLRRIRKSAPWIYKIMKLYKLGSIESPNPYSVEFDFSKNKYLSSI